MADIGGGVSRLVDALLARGHDCLTVVDVSRAALERTQLRVGEQASRVRWVVADVTEGDWPLDAVDLWHDRAVFHFLTTPQARDAYISRLRTTLRPGGAAIMATFAPGGPTRCSGLPVVRYTSAELAAVLGSGFALVDSVVEGHRTPRGDTQAFQWSRLTRLL